MDIVRKFEPLWGVWRCEEVIGEGGFGRVYRAVRREGNYTYYSAIKHISVPANEQQLKDVRTSGMCSSDREVSMYFNEIVGDVQKEINFMYSLRGCANIVSYEDHMIIPKENGIGCDIFIRMELLRDLPSIVTERFPLSEAVKVGCDICNALEVCVRSKIIHRDIKPSNIFVNANGDYKLGDFGIARVLGGATAGVSKKGTYSYMAPEIYKCEPANFTSDIYSLGVVLYRLMNRNRLPFLPLTGVIRPAEQEAAMLKMVSGAPMPPPAEATPQLAAVVLKACSYKMRDRFRNPTEFKKALVDAAGGSYDMQQHTVCDNVRQDVTVIDNRVKNGNVTVISSAFSNPDPAVAANELNKLGDDYYFGAGGKPQNQSQAVKFYFAAAEKGYAEAQCNLGLCYKNGKGVRMDLRQAKYWLTLAAEQGDEFAKRSLLDL